MVSQWWVPKISHAQGRPPAVIEAQSFALTDGAGKVIGTFSVGKSIDGEPAITLESLGHEIWRAPSIVVAPSTVQIVR